jgi:predicted transcriptional regulator
MITVDLIQEKQIGVEISDRISDAKQVFEELKKDYIPILNEGSFLGLLSKEDISDLNTSNPISSIRDRLIDKKIEANRHLFEALSFFEDSQLSYLPVINSHNKYIGLIELHSIINQMCRWLNTSHLKGLIHLELGINDYSLCEIAQIVESNGAKIMSSICITKENNSSRIEVVLNINHDELSAIIETFRRYKYNVITSYQTTNNHKGLNDRFDSFIHYLNI